MENTVLSPWSRKRDLSGKDSVVLMSVDFKIIESSGNADLHEKQTRIILLWLSLFLRILVLPVLLICVLRLNEAFYSCPSTSRKAV